MRQCILLLLLFSLQYSVVLAGDVSGWIRDTDNNPISGVNVFVEGTRLGASSDKDGAFRIINVPDGKHTITASHLGYVSQSVELDVSDKDVSNLNFALSIDYVALKGIEVSIARQRSQIKTDSPVRVEIISPQELTKSTSDGSLLMALGGRTGLNTRPCALCGSAGVGMQGLDPSYTEVNVDNLPVMSGLGSLYGLSSIAVSDVSSVELVKGSSSIEYGAGAIAGAMNVNTRDTARKPSLGLHLSAGETLQHTVSSELQHTAAGIPFRLSVNYAKEPERIDRNNDYLTDTPQFSRLGLNLSIGRTSSLGDITTAVRYYSERRFAGDVRWTENDRGSAVVYGREIYTDRYDASFNFKSEQSDWGYWDFGSAFIYSEQNSWYGATRFDAVQQRIINRLTFNWQVEPAHVLQFQGAYSYEDYNDNLALGSKTDRIESVPGMLISHSWNPNERFSTNLGLRGEVYSEDGLVPLIRGGIRYKFKPEWTVLASSGTGYRTVTIFSLDRAVHAGFDNVQVSQTIKPESSLNNSITLDYSTASISNSLQVDLTAFYTTFKDKVILAYGDHAGMTVYSNAEDAYTRGLELQATWNNIKGWTVDVGGSLNDVQYKDAGGWHYDELRNYWTANLILLKKWNQPAFSADINTRVYGPQKLPEGRSRDEAPIFTILDIGVSKQIRNMILAFSINNVTDWVQPDNPFIPAPGGTGQIIDSAMIYGPLIGRTFRVSLSYSLDLRQ